MDARPARAPLHGQLRQCPYPRPRAPPPRNAGRLLRAALRPARRRGVLEDVVLSAGPEGRQPSPSSASARSRRSAASSRSASRKATSSRKRSMRVRQGCGSPSRAPSSSCARAPTPALGPRTRARVLATSAGRYVLRRDLDPRRDDAEPVSWPRPTSACGKAYRATSVRGYLACGWYAGHARPLTASPRVRSHGRGRSMAGRRFDCPLRAKLRGSLTGERATDCWGRCWGEPARGAENG
jgi:hypothetical protein